MIKIAKPTTLGKVIRKLKALPNLTGTVKAGNTKRKLSRKRSNFLGGGRRR
jgi:hypothetical protein